MARDEARHGKALQVLLERHYGWNKRMGTITKYQKERDYTDGTMTILVDPDDPANIIPGNKSRTIYRSIESGIVVFGISLFFFLIGILFVVQKIG